MIAVVLISLIGNSSFAQTANLNITLSNVLSFSVTQPTELNVNFDTEAKYTNGISATATDHISVVSSAGYTVKATAGSVTGLAALAPGSIKITSAIGTGNTGNTSGITYTSAGILPASGGTALQVIKSTNSTWNGSNSTSKFNITYLIGSGGQYAGKATGVNLIPVTYTVTQP